MGDSEGVRVIEGVSKVVIEVADLAVASVPDDREPHHRGER
jgi:hypothetical protein